MLLALFGGTDRRIQGGQTSKAPFHVRCDSHILVVGDPGLGKSQMLKAMSRIAPRGMSVCGNATSTAGLTVTVVRDSSGDFALEAGALVMADGGVCFIDEFDEIDADSAGLLEGMEQQTVCIAKAGISCNLIARTAAIAADNCHGGHYGKSRTVCENLNLPQPLLSRFDLILHIIDDPDRGTRSVYCGSHYENIRHSRKDDGERSNAISIGTK